MPADERRGVAAAGPDPLALLAHDDRGAGVLAHRQHLAGGDVGVLQQIEGDEPVVVRGLGIVEDVAQLLADGRGAADAAQSTKACWASSVSAGRLDGR